MPPLWLFFGEQAILLPLIVDDLALAVSAFDKVYLY